MTERSEPKGEAIDGACEVLPAEPEKRDLEALNAGNGQFCAPFTPERAEAKEACKLAFVTGKNTLANLADRYCVPYKTLLTWSSEESWGDLKRQLAERTATKVGDNLVEWMAKEREKQVKRALSRSANLQALADEAAGVARESEFGLNPSAVQALAVAEEKADMIARRNLGMEDKGGNHTSLNVNVIGSANFG